MVNEQHCVVSNQHTGSQRYILSAKTAKKEASRAGPILVRDHFETLADYAIA